MKSKLIKVLKQNDIKMPIWLGEMISKIPYSYRPMVGSTYKQRTKELTIWDKLDVNERKQFIFKRMYNLVDYAVSEIPFYKEIYKKFGFKLQHLNSFDDINSIPVIDKSILLQFPIEERSNLNKPNFLVNTGGSSGHTLSFYVQPSSIGNEWAHIHNMWGMLGFKHSNLRLCIVGRSSVKNGVDYEFARHMLSLDMYQSFDKTAPKLKQLLKKSPCYYLHGYPSVLSEFANYCESDVELLNLLKNSLKGAFLSSEYPFSFYRDKIESVFGIASQSFYGHTERCVMAYETSEKFKFKPYQTYGYAEAIKNGEGKYDLVGTSYYNMASPLIRYNTQDLIEKPIWDEGILDSFSIKEGRSGQFILDKEGNKISLTGLVMGRHHDIFDYCSHIQIQQNIIGSALVLYVPKQECELENPENLFDVSNVNIDFTFKRISEPIRTVSGKINLLVK